jgi:phospholipid-translocating ATPase
MLTCDRLYMVDGVYQSVMVFFIPYLLFEPGIVVTGNGLGVEDRLRFGAYIAHPAVITINMYILINTYRWDWLMVLIVVISDVFIFFWTGVYTSFTSSNFFYGTAAQVYQEASFWAVFFLVPVICLFPRFAIKALQKVYWPYDVDIIREQERMGKFAYLTEKEESNDPLTADTKSDKSKSSKSSRKSRKAAKHMTYGSVDEDLRPIYPPSTATRTTTYNQHSQNGSDSTNYTGPRMSMDVPMQARPSIDRARPSYDRVRASMDRVRPSFEASSDFTSAARLSRIESSQSQGGRFRPRLRGLSLTKSANV